MPSMMTSLLPMSNKRKTHHEGEGKKGKEHEEIKKSKGVSEVLERAMNHRDIPGWVSEDAAVWSLINRQCFFPNTGRVRAQQGPLGRIKMGGKLSLPQSIIKKLAGFLKDRDKDSQMLFI